MHCACPTAKASRSGTLERSFLTNLSLNTSLTARQEVSKDVDKPRRNLALRAIRWGQVLPVDRQRLHARSC
eukprot:COSAG03_NODE_5775_length_1176_cov_1.520891_2_plen_70_part_01